MQKQFIGGENITWIITDLDQVDNLLAYCSLNSYVSIYDLSTEKYLLIRNFTNNSNEEQDDSDPYGYYDDRLRLFSTKISGSLKVLILGDKSRVIAASGYTSSRKALVNILDLQANTITHSIKAHNDDVNTICFLNKSDPNIFITGSDDRSVKLWDVRDPKALQH